MKGAHWRADGRYFSGGMSLRDYFAAKALPMAWQAEQESSTHNGPSYQGAAERAYEFADAMLAARNV